MVNLKKSLVALIVVLAFYGAEARGDSFVIPNVQGTAYVTTYIDGGPPIIKTRPAFSLSGPGLSSEWLPAFGWWRCR